MLAVGTLILIVLLSLITAPILYGLVLLSIKFGVKIADKIGFII